LRGKEGLQHLKAAGGEIEGRLRRGRQFGSRNIGSIAQIIPVLLGVTKEKTPNIKLIRSDL